MSMIKKITAAVLALVILGGAWAWIWAPLENYKEDGLLYIKNGLRFAFNYKEYRGGPAMVNQTFIVDDEFIVFTDKLIYENGAPASLYFKSDSPVEVELEKFSNDTHETVWFKQIEAENYTRDVIATTFEGFDRRDFDAYHFQLKNSDAGWFQLKVKNASETRYLPFFVEGKKESDILFVESTDTMQAYVAANGLRTYYKQGKRHLAQDFTRPEAYPMDYQLKNFKQSSSLTEKDCKDHLANADLSIKSGLDAKKITYDNSSDEYLDNYKNISRYKLIIFGAHNEYWSPEKIKNIEKFLLSGGSVLVLGGNTAYRFARKVHSMKVFWGQGFLKTRYENFIYNHLGAYYDSNGYDTYSSFKFINSSSPLMKKQNASIEFGEKSTIVLCEKFAHGASGHETDKFMGTRSGFSVIASGNNSGSGGADIVFKKLDAGGYVLNFSSVSLWHGMDDPVIQEMIRNFIELAKNSQPEKSIQPLARNEAPA
ncbi:MAG: hypothetical protein NTZ64_08080 [Polaromonas sp.]|nr:hypothetical protein [Polaromonas sp.]